MNEPEQKQANEWRVVDSAPYDLKWRVEIDCGLDHIEIFRETKQEACDIAARIVACVNFCGEFDKTFFQANGGKLSEIVGILQDDQKQIQHLQSQLEASRKKPEEYAAYVIDLRKENASLQSQLASVDISIVAFKLYFEQLLGHLKYKNTSSPSSPNQANGYTYAEVADWEIRQKIEGLTAILNQIKDTREN